MLKLYVVVGVVVLPESEEVTVAPGSVNAGRDHQVFSLSLIFSYPSLVTSSGGTLFFWVFLIV